MKVEDVFLVFIYCVGYKMVLDWYQPKTHTKKTLSTYGSGVLYGVNIAIFQDTSEFSSVKFASRANKYGVFQKEISWLADSVGF